jgi:DNA-binding IclR family transcriptional regulator
MRHLLTQGAPGHALLAARPPKEGDPDFVTRVRTKGYAVTSGELLPGATGVAVAVAAPGHEPQAAISAVWIAGFDTDAVAREVVQAARAIAADLRT